MKQVTIYTRLSTVTIFLVALVVLLGESAIWGTERMEHGIPGFWDLLEKASSVGTTDKPSIVRVPKGIYHFYQDQCGQEELYISNGLQQNPRYVGISLRNLKNVIIDFQGSELQIHGQVLPIAMRHCDNCTLRNFIIDSTSPLMQQIEIVKNDEKGIIFKPAPGVRCRTENNNIIFESEFWKGHLSGGSVFDKKTKHLLHNVTDISVNFQNAQQNADGTFTCPFWKDGRLSTGSVVVLRPFIFPTTIFLDQCRDTKLADIKIHYGNAKAVLAQLCENVHLDGVSITLRGADDPRCFTANADSTHFSCCKGKIIVENGVFEAAMDDAINVHGIYTKVVRRVNNKTIHVQFMGQGSWGYEWARSGDAVRFIHSRKMDHYMGIFRIATVKPIDRPDFTGVKILELTFDESLPEFVQSDGTCGVENMAWNPDVVFRKNIVRNNRARGCLFSTGGSVLVEDNLFDHVSGTAILFCGDCNFWYESGPCRNVVIRGNRFVNCMGSFYQYCNAIISIFPEIPDFDDQHLFYYGGREDAFVIEKNEFETFDFPILYGRSIDGLTFRHNKIRHNNDFPKISPIKVPFFFEKADRIRIYKNEIDSGFEPERDIKAVRMPIGSLKTNADEPFGPVKKMANTRNEHFFAYRSFNKEPETTKQFAEIGVKTRCFYAAHTINSMGNSYCEYPPVWKGVKTYDWSAYDQQVKDLLAAHPDEKLICMIDLNTPYWAIRKLAYDSFSAITRAASDQHWYDLTFPWMEDFLRYSEEHFGDRIVAYILAAGGTSEWYEYDRGESSWINNQAWIKWCRKRNLKLGDDTPGESTRHKAAFENAIFDPAKEPEKPAFWQFHNEIIVDAMLRYAHLARELVPTKSIGFFFGYYLVSDPRLVSFGHLDYERIYASPDIDFFISPGNYSDRLMGGGSGPQLVQGTLELYGKHYLHEIDHGTHVSPDWHVWNNQEEDEAGLKRETAYALVNNGSLWIFDMWGKRFTVEKTRTLIRHLKEIADRFKNEKLKSTAEVLMIADPQSMYYTNEVNPIAIALAEGIQNKLNRIGTAYDVYSFNDIPQLDMNRYKAVVLAGTFLITPEREAILKKYVCNGNRAIFWGFAPGICDGKTLDVRRVEKWTGVPRDTSGVSVTDMKGWSSIYSRDYAGLTPRIFRDNMKKANVHFYIDEETPVYANERLIMIHCKNGGEKSIRLPKTYTKVIELYSGKTACENDNKFIWKFDTPDTVLFELVK